MTASILDGKKVAEKLKAQLKSDTQKLTALGKRSPGLAVILVGEDPASQIYVRNKRKACQEVGFQSFFYELPSQTTEHTLLAHIDKLNQQPEVHGILVQLPLPDHINTSHIIEAINPLKDVDGFHPYNFGRLAQGNPLLRPCTPFGIMELLSYYKIQLEGKNAVLVGASNIVGRPMALELLRASATVTLCHKDTQGLDKHVKNADLIVVATGRHDVVDSNWLHEGQILVDVGIHRCRDNKLRGDVDFDEAVKKVSWITPVPGGVGPMTIATLLKNTQYAASI